MLISKAHKVAFIKNKKTASQAMTHALTLGLDAKNWYEFGEWHGYPNELPEFVNVEQGWRIFCFVRCPWDRTISTYEYLRTRTFKIPMDKPFDSWLMDGTPRFESCHDRAKDCTHVYRFENLNHQFRRMLDDLGIFRVGLTVVNATRRRPWGAYYTSQELVNRVAELYSDDIRHYGYAYPQDDSENERN